MNESFSFIFYMKKNKFKIIAIYKYLLTLKIFWIIVNLEWNYNRNCKFCKSCNNFYKIFLTVFVVEITRTLKLLSFFYYYYFIFFILIKLIELKFSISNFENLNWIIFWIRNIILFVIFYF